MKFYKQEIPGAWLIEAEPYCDDRGQFFRHFCQNEFSRHGLESKIVQTNVSQNRYKYTLRGFHYQIKPFEEHKTMFCISGAFQDVIVDLRPSSPTFLKWQSFDLKAGSLSSLHIPAGCANAFLTLEDDTTVLYYISEFYMPEHYRGFRYNDPSFKIKWAHEPKIITEKDISYPDFGIKSCGIKGKD